MYIMFIERNNEMKILSLTICVLSLACQPEISMEQTKEQPKTAAQEPFSVFVERLMEDRAPTLPAYKKELIASTLERVARDTFSTEEEMKQYATVVAIESGFNERAKSKAGAVGLSQVMPQFVTGFFKECGIKDFNKEDLDNMELNLKAGACAFRALLKLNSGNVAAALVSYNAGMNSSSFKSLIKGTSISNLEASNYVTKFIYLKEKHSK